MRKEDTSAKRWLFQHAKSVDHSAATPHPSVPETGRSTGCFNCGSPDHPPYKCTSNPIESSPLYMKQALCSHCEGRGHTKAACKAEGGPCFGVQGAFPTSASTARTQPLVVTVTADLQEHDNSVIQKLPTSPAEIRAMKKALLSPKNEYTLLQERMHFTALKQSKDDFLVLFGDRCERYKRKHHTPIYGKVAVEMGFTTPADCCYRPLGERSRRMETSMKGLVHGMRFPPQTMREVQRKGKTCTTPMSFEAVVEKVKKRGAKAGRHPHHHHHHHEPKPAAAAKKADDDEASADIQLRRLLDVADRRIAQGGDGYVAAKDEMQKRRDHRRAKLYEALAPQPPDTPSDELRALAEKLHSEYTNGCLSSDFSFPRDELLCSQRRVEHAKRGASFVESLKPPTELSTQLPVVHLRGSEGDVRFLSKRAMLEADQSVSRSPTQQQGSHAAEGAAEEPEKTRDDSPVPPRRPQRPSTAPGFRPQRPTSAAKRPHSSRTFLTEPHSPSSTSYSVEGGDRGLVRKKRYINRAKAWELMKWMQKKKSRETDVTPEPRVLVGDEDIEISGYDCNFWGSRYLHHQFLIHNNLQGKLEQRRDNREKVYNEATHLNLFTKKAVRQAEAWYIARQQTPRPASPRSRKTPGTGGTPASPTKHSEYHDVFTAAVRAQSARERRNEDRVQFYDQVLYYCDILGAPTTTASKNFVNTLRQLLLDGYVPDSKLLLDALCMIDPASFSEPEFQKLLQVVLHRIGVDVVEVVDHLVAKGIQFDPAVFRRSHDVAL
eukprot:Sspe_Gene.42482::Locus_20622_Transcript_1_1_Confidence_1.000_Length_2460::g.42482::m.42482